MSPSKSQIPSSSKLLDTAREALSIEILGLVELQASLGATFEQAIDALMATTGRVVVSGIGKSGHIANKIAATFSSTGTPAIFVHPSEASHGDLGMVLPGDTLIMLSNSGETDELLDLIVFAQRANISLIAITQGANSALAKSASVVLLLPKVEEACPMGLAPTTSTTMMLALGDALAVALLEKKGFTANDYKTLHPGGSLGRRLLHVADLMHTGDQLPMVTEATKMPEVLMEVTKKTFGCAGVLNAQGVLIGIITDGDLRRHIDNELLKLTAGEIMTHSPKTIKPGAMAIEAFEVMSDNKITSLFVVAEPNEGPRGIIHIHDLLRAKIV